MIGFGAEIDAPVGGHWRLLRPIELPFDLQQHHRWNPSKRSAHGTLEIRFGGPFSASSLFLVKEGSVSSNDVRDHGSGNDACPLAVNC
jgi:hypothetical protein